MFRELVVDKVVYLTIVGALNKSRKCVRRSVFSCTETKSKQRSVMSCSRLLLHSGPRHSWQPHEQRQVCARLRLLTVPLLRPHRAVRGDAALTHRRSPGRNQHPLPPRPPDLHLLQGHLPGNTLHGYRMSCTGTHCIVAYRNREIFTDYGSFN